MTEFVKKQLGTIRLGTISTGLAVWAIRGLIASILVGCLYQINLNSTVISNIAVNKKELESIKEIASRNADRYQHIITELGKLPKEVPPKWLLDIVNNTKQTTKDNAKAIAELHVLIFKIRH